MKFNSNIPKVPEASIVRDGSKWRVMDDYLKSGSDLPVVEFAHISRLVNSPLTKNPTLVGSSMVYVVGKDSERDELYVASLANSREDGKGNQLEVRAWAGEIIPAREILRYEPLMEKRFK